MRDTDGVQSDDPFGGEQVSDAARYWTGIDVAVPDGEFSAYTITDSDPGAASRRRIIQSGRIYACADGSYTFVSDAGPEGPALDVHDAPAGDAG